MSKDYLHWHVTSDKENIVWLGLDKHEAGTNVLSADVLMELEAILTSIEQQNPKGVIFYSAKPSGFIAGADVAEFTSFTSPADALTAIKRGQHVMNSIEALPCPTLALIEGFCLGGGLELALSCDYRIALDSPSIRLGLPEVKLGIHPGFGGTVRAIETIGVLSAMVLMLTGRTVTAKAAKKMGLIDDAVPQRQLHHAAQYFIHQKPAKHKPAFYLSLLSQPLVRPWLGWFLTRQVAKKADKKHYPAPYAVINLWQQYIGDRNRMMVEEANNVSALLLGETAQNLVRVFNLQNQLKALGKQSTQGVTHVHVIGGGVMGGDIAIWCAYKGLTVTVTDNHHEHLAKVMQRAKKLYHKKLRDPRLVQAALDRLTPDPEGVGLKRANVVIEAIVENLQAKQQLFKEVETKVGKNCIIASNTSSIPIEEISAVLSDPKRLVGLHFFNPVSQMPLVEIVSSELTDEKVITEAAAFARKIDKLPLPVRSSPGFLVNRILMPYLLESVVLYDEGVPPQLIDKAAKDFGMPMGPIELADTVGLDICLSVAAELSQHLDTEVPDVLKDKVDKGQLGKKSGQGFYHYQQGKRVRQKTADEKIDINLLQQRMIHRLLNEAMACLDENIVDSKEQLDAGIIFGTGFAPFRGGPLHYIEANGVDQLLTVQRSLANQFGERFEPNAGWSSLKGEGA